MRPVSEVSSAPTGGELGRILWRVVQRLLGELGNGAAVQGELAGGALLACERVARERPSEFRQALERGELDALLRPAVRDSVRREQGVHRERGQSFGAAWGTFVGPDGRALEDEAEDNTDLEALELGQRALKRAFSLAAAEGNDTMTRNLGWYAQRLSHRTYESIARGARRPPATVRTGVARAKKFVLRVVHELQSAQPAPLRGDAPDEIEPLRRLWAEQDLDALARELERTRGRHGDDPHWLNLAGLLASDRRRRDEAAKLYRRGLVFADAPNVRGRLLNNLGNLAEDGGDLEEAQRCWQRAHQVLPSAPAPLLNLLAAASQAQNYAAAQHFISELSDLLNSGKLSEEERGYLSRRLRQHPKLAWLRETEAWRLGPARWIRGRRRAALARRAHGAALLLAGLVLGFLAAFATGVAGSLDLAKADSAAERVLVAGDSMGKSTSGGEPPRGPKRVRAG